MKNQNTFSSNGKSRQTLLINNRHADVAIESFTTANSDTQSLPIIDWSKIKKAAPTKLTIDKRRPQDPLPEADLVIITWTSAEWLAMNHVFLDSDKQCDSNSYEWRKNWHQYTRGASDYVADKKSGTLWGLFQMVQITDQSGRPWKVLLFKSNSHLAHSPWIDGLSAMMKLILTDTKAKRVYTIGTAGGARINQSLGDAIITNSAVLELQRPQNTSDKENGFSYRCPSWYPSTSILNNVEENLLFKMDTVANNDSFNNLFNQLKAKHSNDPSLDNIKLDDLINEPLNPESLANPKIQSLKDVPLLTTDFYYVACDHNSDAYAFLEMDDAIIAREANAMGVDFACIRNVSDPIVPSHTQNGQVISESVRGDWSGLIYSTFGLFTSFNGALATWATVAGEGSTVYNPERNKDLSEKEDPLEVKLAYQVRSCGTCNFFWPDDKKLAPYGPYSAFDFDVNIPYPKRAEKDKTTSQWLLARTTTPAFPNGEVIDGCRKAPIMTIGINPNLTAFAPGQNGAPWAYPNFKSTNNTDAWEKYAWYYRYRTVYQEKFPLNIAKKYTIPEGQITAPRDGRVTEAKRPDSNPTWTIKVRYQGDAQDTIIELPGKVGDFPYMLFYDTFEPNNTFVAGDLLAGKVAIPEGIQTEVLQVEQGYYMQFVPTLNIFQNYLTNKGIPNVKLEIGEDVSQIDMVGCASPHWNEGFLGNQLDNVVNNCVSKNGWAIKQIVQSQPEVLYIVSESSWNMFNNAFGNFVDKGRISEKPADNAYTLLRETTDNNKPVYVNFNFTVDNIEYSHKIRVVITPHFSFSNNFIPQYRIKPSLFNQLEKDADFKALITPDNGFTIIDQDPDHPYYYREIQLDATTYNESREFLNNTDPALFGTLEPCYYNPHEMMSSVLISMYNKKELSYDVEQNYLTRSEGACKFCVNQHWQFNGECRYAKTAIQSPTPGYLEKVANYIIKNGKPEVKKENSVENKTVIS